jgi:TonB-dependent receptor
VFEQKRNSGSGNLLGIEITADRKFDFLPGFLNGFGVKSNISWFDSEATLLTKERSGETVPLFQQPEMTANASLYYNKHGLYAQLSYNRRGAYLQSVVAGENVNRIQERIGDGPDALDIYVAAGNRWDFTMRYQIRPGLQIFFEAVNIANEPLLRYRGNTTRPYSVQYTQAFYSIGLKWNL